MAGSTAAPSTLTVRPFQTSSRSPVALTMTSASSVRPDFSFSPVSVKVSMWSVAISARPSEIALNMSASGTRQTRWSQGL